MAVKLLLKQKEEGLSYQQNPAYINKNNFLLFYTTKANVSVGSTNWRKLEVRGTEAVGGQRKEDAPPAVGLLGEGRHHRPQDLAGAGLQTLHFGVQVEELPHPLGG